MVTCISLKMCLHIRCSVDQKYIRSDKLLLLLLLKGLKLHDEFSAATLLPGLL